MAVKPFVVGISGGSAAGKTTVARLLAEKLDERYAPQVIGVDSYFADHSHLPQSEASAVNYDVPDALDFDRLGNDIRALVEGNDIFVPCYDYATHSSSAGPVPTKPARLMIVEGILLFHPPQIQPLLDFRIFVDADRDERLRRRIARDVAERGRSRESVIKQFDETVEPGFLRYIEPTRCSTDHCIDWNRWDHDAIRQTAGIIAAQMEGGRMDGIRK